MTLLYLVRTGSLQPWPKHREFWQDYLMAQGAVVDQVEPVFGGWRKGRSGRVADRHMAGGVAYSMILLFGLAAYFGLRHRSGPHAQRAVTVTLVALMGSYALAVVLLPLLHIRLDQAGDNAYYLGLLFTLASMAFALSQISALRRGPRPLTLAYSKSLRISESLLRRQSRESSCE